jgi:hypothetical protein
VSDKRVTRSRILASDHAPAGLDAALSSRNGKAKIKRSVVEYFGTDDDTPAVELLKAIAPVTQHFREGSHVHVSDVVSKCVRKIALTKKLGMRHATEVIRDGQGITFAIGDSLHDYVKGRYIKGHPDKVWAEWKCGCGQTSEISVFNARKTKVCPICSTAVDKHNEVPFLDDEFDLIGNPDLLLWMAQYGAYYVVEIKSMAGSQFNELSRPVPDHVVQTTFYWYLLKKLGFPVVDKISILYVNKEFSFKFPYKEFMITPDVEGLLAPYLEDLENLRASLAGGPLPPRTMCGATSSPMAKKCAVCATCFQMD